jgi:hypothetical protein
LAQVRTRDVAYRHPPGEVADADLRGGVEPVLPAAGVPSLPAVQP